MKKNLKLFGFAASLLFSNILFAQTATPASGSATLNVKLLPIISLEFQGGEAGKVIDLIYTTQDNYTNGVSKSVPNHFKVTSMGGYKIKAKAADLVASGAKSQGTTIGAGSIKLTVNGGNETQLSNNYVDLFSENTQVSGKSFDITYKGAGNDEYKSKYFSGENPTVYTTQVMYSVEAL